MPDAIHRVGDLAAGPLEGRGLDRDQAEQLRPVLSEDLPAVLYYADRIRRRHRGDRVRLCGILAAKLGMCGEDCAWCAQSSRHETAIEPYPLPRADELLRRGRRALRGPVGHLGLVTSGAAPSASEFERLCKVIGELAADGARPCASLGHLDERAARRLAEAGCRRYNHNLETSRAHFPKVVTTHTYDDRVATARAVKAAGMELCCGGLFGIGETMADRIDLALAVRELGADVVPVNFLNPIPGTPLADVPRLSPRECLATLAMLRFVLPDRQITMAGGREVNLRSLQSCVFYAGADGLIAGDYLTTAGRETEDDLQMIADLGLQVAEERSETDGEAVPAGGSNHHVQ